jgi:hypothetical protein
MNSFSPNNSKKKVEIIHISGLFFEVSDDQFLTEYLFVVVIRE